MSNDIYNSWKNSSIKRRIARQDAYKRSMLTLQELSKMKVNKLREVKERDTQEQGIVKKESEVFSTDRCSETCTEQEGIEEKSNSPS